MRITGSDFMRFHEAWKASSISDGMVFDTPARSYGSLRTDDGEWTLDPETVYELDDLGSIRSTSIPRMLVVDTEKAVLVWLHHLSGGDGWQAPAAPSATDVQQPEAKPATGAATEGDPSIEIRDFVAAHPNCKGTPILDHLIGRNPGLDRKVAQRMVSRAREQGYIVKGEGGTWSVDGAAKAR